MTRIIDSDFLHRALKHFYGYDSFRDGQEEIISKILHGQLSAAVAAAARRDAGYFAADFADEGSGGGADGARHSCGLSGQ